MRQYPRAQVDVAGVLSQDHLGQMRIYVGVAVLTRAGERAL
jgi:hypothetical protein